MGELAARVMNEALINMVRYSDVPWDEWNGSCEDVSIRTWARLAFRFAMKARPVPAWVYEILSTSHIVISNERRFLLERQWNIPHNRVSPPTAVIGRLSCREPNLRVDTK
jgi:hypothetical protein